MYNLQQQYIEKYLHDAVAASDLIDMRWQSEVAGIETARRWRLRCDIATPDGNYRLDADYVLAADGARSPIRSMLGLRLKGDNYEGRYVIADIRMDHDFPTERRAFFEPSGNPGGTVLIHKQPDDIWRVDYQLREGESEEEALREENIRARVGAILADIGHTKPWELEWWSVYSANTLCLDDYRHGRVFFIGDAAHIVPIFGVRGLNNGLADADNIAWKLALRAARRSGRPPARQLFAGAARRDARCVRQRHQEHALHDAADPRLAAGARGRAVAQPEARIPARPRQSPADAALHLFGKPADALCRTAMRNSPAGPVCGSVAPNARLADGSHLLDHAGNGMTAIAVLRRARRMPNRPRCSINSAGSTSALYRWSSIAPVPRRHKAIADNDGEIARLFAAAPGTLYLLRPDLHIAGRWKTVVRRRDPAHRAPLPGDSQTP